MRPTCHAGVLAAGLVLLAAGGCMERSQYRGVRSPLDQAFSYYEVDRHDTKHPLDGTLGDKANREQRRVPAPAIVDMDSQVQVLVDKDRLVSPSARTLAKKPRDELLARKTRIQDALKALGNYIEARRVALQLYSGGNQDAFIAARRAFGAAEGQFIGKLDEVWGETAPERPTLEAAFTNLSQDPEMTAFRTFLQDQIAAMEAGDQALAKDLRENTRALRLEAQVMSGTKDPLFVHLEGYDTREQGGLQTRDRWGLNLSAEDRQDLTKHMEATREVAATLEDVRQKKMSFQEAVVKAGPSISEPLAADIAKIQDLVVKYSPAAVQKKAAEISRQFEQLVDKVKASNLPDNARAQFLGMPERFKEWLTKGGLDRMGQLSGTIQSVEQLQVRWRNPAPKDQTALLLDTAAAFGKLRDVLSDPQFSANLGAGAMDFVKAESGTLADNVRATLTSLADSDEFKSLQSSVNTVVTDFMTMRTVAQDILGNLKIFREATAPLPVTAPDTLEVPLEDVRDTSMDLRRVRLSRGEEIVLRATLKEGDKEIDSSTASFKAEHLGWYANLSPSVVLAKPTELAGGEDDFRFAPALSWLHHYVPRPEEQQWYMEPLRVLDPAIGLHAIFLCFDTQANNEAIQIGLGATLSLWKERLQFGAGYNLMADSDDDGRYYFFVGTDLIGLLQTVTGQPAR